MEDSMQSTVSSSSSSASSVSSSHQQTDEVNGIAVVSHSTENVTGATDVEDTAANTEVPVTSVDVTVSAQPQELDVTFDRSQHALVVVPTGSAEMSVPVPVHQQPEPVGPGSDEGKATGFSSLEGAATASMMGGAPGSSVMSVMSTTPGLTVTTPGLTVGSTPVSVVAPTPGYGMMASPFMMNYQPQVAAAHGYGTTASAHYNSMTAAAAVGGRTFAAHPLADASFAVGPFVPTDASGVASSQGQSLTGGTVNVTTSQEPITGYPQPMFGMPVHMEAVGGVAAAHSATSAAYMQEQARVVVPQGLHTSITGGTGTMTPASQFGAMSTTSQARQHVQSAGQSAPASHYVGTSPLTTFSPDQMTLTTTGGVVNQSTTSTNMTMSTSRLHNTGSRTGRWVTNVEGHMVEEQLMLGAVHVVGERIVEKEVVVPKKVLREQHWEKVVYLPETEVTEEVVEDVHVVREKIVEYARQAPEKIVEVPEIEYVEKIVEVPETIVQEKIIEMPKLEVRERIVEIPTIITQEKVVEYPEVEYKEVVREKVVEVPQIVEEISVKEVSVPQFVDKVYPEYVNVEEKYNVERKIPVPVEVQTTWRYELPKLRPRFSKVKVPLYVPRFIEYPVPKEMMGEALEAEAISVAQHVALISQQPAISLCEVENVAATIKRADFQTQIDSRSRDFTEALKTTWGSSGFRISPAANGVMTSRQMHAAYFHSGNRQTHHKMTKHVGTGRKAHKSRTTHNQSTVRPKTANSGHIMQTTTTTTMSTAHDVQQAKAYRPAAMALLSNIATVGGVNNNKNTINSIPEGRPFVSPL